MKKPLKLIGFLAICAVLIIPLGALADSIQPSSITFIGSGEFLLHKAVNILKDTTGSVATYSLVRLDFSELPGPSSVGFIPAGYSGSYDRSIDRTFEFDLDFDFRSIAPGTYDFNIYALVDDVRVATEHDTLHVPAPVPASVLLLGSGLLGLGGWRRFGKS